MKSIYFDKKTKFESSDALKKISGISNIYFEKDTTVTFEGKITTLILKNTAIMCK